MTNEATKTTDNVTWLCPDCRTVTVDMADVTALQAAYDALKAENEQLSCILENTRTQRDEAYRERAAAQQWQQLVANEEHIQEDKTVLIENQGQWVGIKRGDTVFGAWLDDLGCAIFRKVQP